MGYLFGFFNELARYGTQDFSVILMAIAPERRRAGQRERVQCFNFSTEPVFLKVHKIENFFDSDFGICVISLLVMHK